MIATWLSQIGAIVRLEMRKTFFAKRGLWVYLLALGPAALYMGHSLVQLHTYRNWQQMAAAHKAAPEYLRSLQSGATLQEVEASAGEPYYAITFHRPRRTEDYRNYTDGSTDFRLFFVDGALRRVFRRTQDTISEDSLIFATVFQFFYLRLAVFFGCVGIFVNLFRGELLDKSLHFYLLAPVRREVLLAGKYLAGLIATVVIFTTSTGLQMLAMSWHFERAAISEYLSGPGWQHAAAYVGVTALACLGYGSVFLAAGLLYRNPIIPAALVLVWEAANIFLPTALKKLSIIFYLQSLCPVVAPPGQDMPPPVRLLISSAEPVSAPVAILGLMAVTAVILVVAARQARRLEINYGTE